MPEAAEGLDRFTQLLASHVKLVEHEEQWPARAEDLTRATQIRHDDVVAHLPVLREALGIEDLGDLAARRQLLRVDQHFQRALLPPKRDERLEEERPGDGPVLQPGHVRPD